MTQSPPMPSQGERGSDVAKLIERLGLASGSDRELHAQIAVAADLESTILDWPCEAQFQLATRIAANVGYVLAPEPLIDRPAPAAEVTGELASKNEQIGKLYRVCNERDV